MGSSGESVPKALPDFSPRPALVSELRAAEERAFSKSFLLTQDLATLQTHKLGNLPRNPVVLLVQDSPLCPLHWVPFASSYFSAVYKELVKMFSSFNYNLSFFFLKAKDSLLAGGQNTSSWAGGLPAESRENDFRHRLEPVFLVLGTLQILLWVYFSWVETLPGFANDMGLFVTLDPSGAHREGSCLESVPLSSLVLMKEELWCLLPTTLDFCQISLVVLSLNMSHLPPKPRQCFLYQ